MHDGYERDRYGRCDFPNDVYFKSGAPYYDAISWGAKCDGTTDDTTAISAMMAAVVASGGQGGTVYFPKCPSGASEKFNGNAFNQSGLGNNGTITIIDDAPFLLTGPVTPVSHMTFIGRGSPTAGLITQHFKAYTPWTSTSTGNSVLSITGNNQQIAFDGIGFIAPSGATVPPVSITSTSGGGGNAPTFLTFNYDSFYADNTAQPSLSVVIAAGTGNGGYNYNFDHDTFTGTLQGSTASIVLTNFGVGTFSHSLIYSAPVYLISNGSSVSGGLEFDDVNSEALTNQDFLILDTSTPGAIAQIQLNRVNLSDTSGTVYVVKGIGVHNHDIEINQSVDGNVGTGMLDPATTTAGLAGVWCRGIACRPSFTTKLVLT